MSSTPAVDDPPAAEASEDKANEGKKRDSKQQVLSLEGEQKKNNSIGAVWTENAYLALFADSYVDHTDSAKIKDLTILPSLQFFRKTLNHIINNGHDEGWLEPLPEDAINSITNLERLVNECITLSQQLPLGTRNEEKLTQFLAQFMTKVVRMGENDLLLIPGGWMKSTNKRHAMMYVLERHSTTFRMTFINLGEGLEYHPISASFPPKMKQKLSFMVDDIPVERIIDSNFWFFLFRLQVWPSPAHNAKALYEVLIPSLNAKPVFANIDLSQSLMEWRSLPRASRETALFRCVKESLHFSLRAMGFSIGLAKYMSVVYRWAVCHMV